MENDKSPGTDGIPIESYITLYEAIENDFLQPYNDIPFNKQNATKTMHQAIIIPISLLRLDYKTLTKILSNRLKNILPDIILEEQDCSIPKRNIFNNLFLIRDVIMLSKEKNTKFYILQIDQEKAFNKKDHEFLYKTMEKNGLLKYIYKLHPNFV